MDKRKVHFDIVIPEEFDIGEVIIFKNLATKKREEQHPNFVEDFEHGYDTGPEDEDDCDDPDYMPGIDEDDEEYVAMENQLLPNPDEDMSDESGGEEQEAVMETVKPNNPKKGTAKKKKGKAKASAAVPESYDFGDHF